MEQPNIFMSYLRVTQHMSQQFRSHFGRLDLTFPQALVLTVLGRMGRYPSAPWPSAPEAPTARCRALWTGWKSWGWPDGSAARRTGG